jgi:hypothetical protein
MELLLNLFWLTLALPAAWLLKNKAVPAPKSLRITRFRPFLLMACVLTLLFPVVSASDDLHAMRPEIEESGGLIVELFISIILLPTLYVLWARPGDKLPPPEIGFTEEGEHVD